MKKILRIVLFFFFTVPLSITKPDAGLLDQMIRTKMSLLERGLMLLTGNRRRKKSVDSRSPPSRHWTTSYFVPPYNIPSDPLFND